MMVNGMVNAIGKNILNNASGASEETARLVFETHEKINRVLGYADKSDRAAVRERIRLSLMQPVEEIRYEKGIGSETSSGFSVRLIVMISLAFVAVILLILALVVFRKR